MKVNFNNYVFALGTLVLFLNSACDDAEDGAPDASDTSDTDGGTPDASTPERYLIGARIFSADGSDTTSYFHVTRSLDADTEVDTSKALEIFGAAKLFSIGELGFLAIGAAEEPEITRYELDEDDELVAKERISLQPEGVTALWETLYVVSPTKVYYPDRAGQQLVILDPSRMRIEGSIPLPETAREGYLALYSYSALERDGQIIFSVGWFDWTNDRVLDETGLVVIDTESDEVVRVDTDERCGGITTPITLESGDTYYVSSALNAAGYVLDLPASEPCALRILDGETSFDGDYAQKLSELADGALAGEPVPASGGDLFLRVLDADADTSEAALTWEVTGLPAWSWWRWTPGEDTAEQESALASSTSDTVWFTVNGKVIGSQTEADYSETLLIDLNAEGGPEDMITVPGFVFGVTKL